MIGDERLYSQKITRTTEQGGQLKAGWCTEVGPIYPKQIAFGPCKSVVIQCPLFGRDPTINNPWFIAYGDANFQVHYLSPGAVSPVIEIDRLDYLWVIRQFDWGAAEADNTTSVDVGWRANYDPPSEPYEAEGLNPRFYQPHGLSDYEEQVLAELRRIAGK